MAALVGQRAVQMIPVLLIVTLVAFGVTMLLPGDPALAILGPDGARNERAYRALRDELGLDQPVPVQYVSWLGRTLRGDLGRSAINKQPVVEALRERLPPTIELGLLGLLLAIMVGVPLGLYAAVHRGSYADLFVSMAALVGVAMPSFWLSILLIQLFALDLRLVPASGYVPLWENPVENLRRMALPMLVLGLDFAAGLMRQVRSAMLEVLNQEYVRTAHAKGLPSSSVIWGHALRNALVPVVTIIGLRVGRLVAGAVVVESVFAIPGIGRLAVESIYSRDFPMIQAVVLLVAVGVLVSNFLTDLAYGYLDPRIRYA